MALNKKGWKLLCVLAAGFLVFNAFFVVCWGAKLIWILKSLDANAHVFTGFTPLIWHIEELGYKLERANAIYWMCLGGAIIQTINGFWRWMAKD